jgi:hypothetical protein
LSGLAIPSSWSSLSLIETFCRRAAVHDSPTSMDASSAICVCGVSPRTTPHVAHTRCAQHAASPPGTSSSSTNRSRLSSVRRTLNTISPPGFRLRAFHVGARPLASRCGEPTHDGPMLSDSGVPSPANPWTDDPRRRHALHRTALGAVILLVIEAGLGMAVNLYVTVPAHHSGAHPSNYFSGSVRSVGWAISHGPDLLAIHAIIGLLLALFVTQVVVRAAQQKQHSMTAWATGAGLLVIGAGFNGASFLDFNESVNSLLMALLTFAAIICYAVMLYLGSVPGRSSENDRSSAGR